MPLGIIRHPNQNQTSSDNWALVLIGLDNATLMLMAAINSFVQGGG